MAKVEYWEKKAPEVKGYYMVEVETEFKNNKRKLYFDGEIWKHSHKSKKKSSLTVVKHGVYRKGITKETKCKCNNPDIYKMEHTIICRNCDWCSIV